MFFFLRLIIRHWPLVVFIAWIFAKRFFSGQEVWPNLVVGRDFLVEGMRKWRGCFKNVGSLTGEESIWFSHRIERLKIELENRVGEKDCNCWKWSGEAEVVLWDFKIQILHFILRTIEPLERLKWSWWQSVLYILEKAELMLC